MLLIFVENDENFNLETKYYNNCEAEMERLGLDNFEAYTIEKDNDFSDLDITLIERILNNF